MATPNIFSAVPPVSAHPSERGARLLDEDRRILIASVTRDLESIEHAWCRHDEVDLLDRIHSLKGALFIVGEHAAANECGVAERCIETKGVSECEGDMVRLKLVLQGLIDRYTDS